ncbi:MAG: glycosyltransferase family 4 protein [Thermoplasmata archaeon]|nr:glycosyltransferase family 4 protein [Thermoplasmata archaeon]
MESLKIAMLAPEFLPNWGGAGTYTILLARELSKSDEIHVFTTIRGDSQTSSKKQIEEYFKGRVNIHILSTATDRFFYNAIYQLNVARRLPVLLEKEKFDIIHSNHAHMPDLGLKLRKVRGHSITTVHTTMSSQYQGIKRSAGYISHMDGSEKMVRFGYPFLSVIERYYLNKTDNMIFVSDFIRRDAERILGKAAPRGVVIRNGVDLERFRNNSVSASNPNKLNIMYCGRLLALKGLNNLMEAFAMVHKSNPGTHLTLVGGGDAGQWAETARASGVPDGAISFLGQKKYEEIPDIINRADILVLPSISESMPLSLLEAMACGRACVASRVGGIPEIITHGEDGFLFTPGDSNELADCLNRLIGDQGIREEFGRKARERIVSNFSLKDTVRQTRDMFLSVVGGTE